MNLPAIPTASEFQTMKELGQMAIKSGFLPVSIKTPEQAVVIMLKGRELGIPPMQAFSGINVIQGKPAVSPELMSALIYKNVPGAVINFVKTDNTTCVIQAKRPGGAISEFSFTIEDAKRAGLTSKGTWQSFPAAMLRARCVSAMARALFPDAIAGCSYTPEELGAEIDDEGNVVAPPSEDPARDVSPEPEPKVETPKAGGTGGDHVIMGGALLNQTIAQVVEIEGLPKIQDYMGKLEKYAERDKRPLRDWERFLKVNLERYANELKSNHQEAHDEAPNWGEVEFDTALDHALARSGAK
jgi:hypothetical protein